VIDRLSGVGSHHLEFLGPYFFEDNKDAAITVTSELYVAMLRNFCEPELRHRGIDLSSVWFQQGATAHTAGASISVLQEMFPQHVISMAAMFA